MSNPADTDHRSGIIYLLYMHLESLKIQAWRNPTSNGMYHISGCKYKITL